MIVVSSAYIDELKSGFCSRPINFPIQDIWTNQSMEALTKVCPVVGQNARRLKECNYIKERVKAAAARSFHDK